jgi:hypothetical protein
MPRKKKEVVVEEEVQAAPEEKGIRPFGGTFNREDLQGLADKVNELVEAHNCCK